MAIDVRAAWPSLIPAARLAGLSDDSMAAALSCSTSNLSRWESGQTAPGPAARTSIKAKLIDLLEAA